MNFPNFPSLKNFKIELCDPLNTWVDKDPKSRYMKNAYKSVVRKWMSIEEIEIKFGDYLSDKDLKTLREWKNFYEDDDASNFALITGVASRCGKLDDGIWAGTGVHPYDDTPDDMSDLIPVYEVEWIDSKKEKDKWIGYCYHVIRIAEDIYVLDYDDIMMPRNPDEPN